MTPEREVAVRDSWRPAVVLVAAGLASALGELYIPGIVGFPVPAVDAMHVVVGLGAVALALQAANRPWRLPWRAPSVAIGLAVLGCILTGWLAGVSWPNSGDEYSYVFLADTFLAGRLWNTPPSDPGLFAGFHILVKDGRLFSPYPPGWSAFLVPFRALGAVWLANPVLTGILGVALAGSFVRLRVGRAAGKPLLALVLLTPFTLFLGGSVFPQTMAAALVACIVWSALSDEAHPSAGRKLLAGALFGLLLLTRYDVFAIVALLYAADRLAIRRLGALADALPVLLGGLPFVACQLIYDAAITGNPLQLTATWVVPQLFDTSGGVSGVLLAAAKTNLYWFGGLAEFAGLPVMVLGAVALVLKIRARTCRFFDFVLPVAMVCYAFLPFSGGHQYGPRYWFWAWPLASLTIATGLVDPDGNLWIAGRRMALEGFAAACLMYAAGALCVLIVTTHVFIAARRAIFDVPRPEGKAVVLLPVRDLIMWPWQRVAIEASSLDFTRNGVDLTGGVVYGRADVADSVARACRLAGRAVFRWEEPGRLVRETCP